MKQYDTPPHFFQSLIFRLLASLLLILLVIFSAGYVINVHLAQHNLYQQRDEQIMAQRERLNQDVMAAESRQAEELKAQLEIVALSAQGPLLNALSTVKDTSVYAEQRTVDQFARCFQNGATHSTYECLKIRSNYFSMHSTRIVNRLMIKTTIQLLLSHEDMIAVEILDWQDNLFDGFTIDQTGNVTSIGQTFRPPAGARMIRQDIVNDEYLGQVVFYYDTTSIDAIRNKAEAAIIQFSEYTEQQVISSSQQIARTRLAEGSLLFLVSLSAISGIVILTVIAPLLSLTRKAEALSRGDFSYKDDTIYRNDELGHLARTFQTMSHNLRRYYDELQQVNHQLEHKVRERTAELERKNRELHTLSVTDKLTQIYNRVKLEDEFVCLLETVRSGQCSHGFSVLICDIDYFKQINDNYGHQVGDRVLVETARILQQVTRDCDIVGRWGGEEFLILCPETDHRRAMELAEALRQAVEQYAYPALEKGSTLSIGVSSYSDGDNQDALMEQADMALYAAKNAGRNKVCSAVDLLSLPLGTSS